MQYYTWNKTKNEQFKHERGVSFEEIAFQIEKGDLPDVIQNPGLKQYNRIEYWD
jgi:hypothetical protein